MEKHLIAIPFFHYSNEPFFKYGDYAESFNRSPGNQILGALVAGYLEKWVSAAPYITIPQLTESRRRISMRRDVNWIDMQNNSIEIHVTSLGISSKKPLKSVSPQPTRYSLISWSDKTHGCQRLDKQRYVVVSMQVVTTTWRTETTRDFGWRCTR